MTKQPSKFRRTLLECNYDVLQIIKDNPDISQEGIQSLISYASSTVLQAVMILAQHEFVLMNIYDKQFHFTITAKGEKALKLFIKLVGLEGNEFKITIMED